MKTALILLTYNAAQDIPKLMPAVMQQSLQPDVILAIDSSSSDNTIALLKSYPLQIHQIQQSEFDHGGTRKLATQLVDADTYIFLTQDAYPANPDAFQEIVSCLYTNDKIGCAFGRQLAKDNATPVSKHLRLFNYPATSHIRTYEDKLKYGIKTCFNSDSFAAYKKIALEDVGNFPTSLMTAEDAYIAAKMLLQDYQIAYAANAYVYHSHNLSLKEEFHRYFSIGVFHGKERWILDHFSSPTGEGWRFVKSELTYLCKQRQFHWLPRALASTFVKFMAYQLGLNENKIPLNIKRKMGINTSYWKTSTQQ